MCAKDDGSDDSILSSVSTFQVVELNSLRSHAKDDLNYYHHRLQDSDVVVGQVEKSREIEWIASGCSRFEFNVQKQLNNSQ